MSKFDIGLESSAVDRGASDASSLSIPGGRITLVGLDRAACVALRPCRVQRFGEWGSRPVGRCVRGRGAPVGGRSGVAMFGGCGGGRWIGVRRGGIETIATGGLVVRDVRDLGASGARTGGDFVRCDTVGGRVAGDGDTGEPLEFEAGAPERIGVCRREFMDHREVFRCWACLCIFRRGRPIWRDGGGGLIRVYRSCFGVERVGRRSWRRRAPSRCGTASQRGYRCRRRARCSRAGRA